MKQANFSSFSVAVSAIAVAIFFVAPAASQTYDVIFQGGQVMDGTGSPAVVADVGVVDDTIAAIGDLSQAKSRRTISISGKTLVPGFIDLHSHADGPSDRGLRSRDERRRAAPNLVTQGVTTVVVNQDGRSPDSIERQREQMDRRGIGPNAILMVGHNTVRAQVLGQDYKRAATPEEVEKMAGLVREGMKDGAWGLSAGLEYTPGIWSETEEVIALVKLLKPFGGIYVVHERSSGSDPMWFLPSQDPPNQSTMLDNVHEQIRIAEETGVTTVATHIKARGENYWGSSKAIIDAMKDARDRGVPIWADQYPYNTSGSDGEIVLIPQWVAERYRTNDENGNPDYAETLRRAIVTDETRAELERDIHHMIVRRGNAEHIIIFDHPNEAFIGKTLAALALTHERSPVEMVYELQFHGYKDRFGGVRLRGFSMSEVDVAAFAAQPWTMTASDAGIALPDDPPVHPRYYGTFPRKIRHYAIEQQVLSVEQAIRSMTSLPAEILRLEKRGTIARGNAADIAVIDLARIRDMADFFRPHQYASGVDYVMVRGKFVVEAGRLTYALPGKVLTPAENAIGS